MPSFFDLIKNPVLFFAFGFGSGLAKNAPGTWGTLVGVPVYLLLVYFASNTLIYISVTVVCFLLGIWICDQTEKKLGLHDPGNIVWDEIVGLMVTMTFLPATYPWIIAGFIVFRFFDILKPWPIKWFDQHCTGGFGVMVDDVIAGLVACGILNFIHLAL